jgi:prephenate dehydratase
MATTISIQGYEGSFHQIAAQEFFGEAIGVLPCDTFRQVVNAVQQDQVHAGMMAIENSIAGSILANYNLLQQSGLTIVGEVYLPIRQHLLVNPGVELEEIREVHSHPMALHQCSDFLVQHPWKLVETEDTALSARKLHQHRSKHIAAIASSLAASLYGLEIAAADIHTEPFNYTRFLALQQKSEKKINGDKASLSFQTDHTQGSLAKVLTAIAQGGINLSKLQSFPIAGSKWKYRFHADFEFDDVQQFTEVLASIKGLTTAINIFGVYKNGNKA